MNNRTINEDSLDVPSENYDEFIEDQISYYKGIQHRDEELWEDFRLDFAKWTSDDFKELSKRKRGILRSFLRDNGIYINKSDTVADGLTNLLDTTGYPEWPRKELDKIIATRKFNSRRNPDLQGSYAYPRKEEEKAPIQNISSIATSPTDVKPIQYQPPQQKSLIDNTPAQTYNAQDVSRSDKQISQQYRPANGPSQASYNIQNLHKMYQKEDVYSGADDVFDKKLRIFYDLCFKANIDHSDYAKAFATMLTGEARDYYFNKISEQRQERKTIEWEDTKLEDFKERYPDKTLHECFDIMRDKLMKDQAILRSELQTDATIRDKLYRACRDVPECNLALFRRSPTFQGASEEIWNSLAIQSRIPSQKAFTAYDADPLGSHEVLFTDRKYKGKTSRFENHPNSSRNYDKTKKCFICKKPGCWSTNHSDEQRRLSFQKFKNAKWNESKIQQFVNEYEGLDPENVGEYEEFINEMNFEDETNTNTSSLHISKVFTTDIFGEVNGEELIKDLERQSTIHAFSRGYGVPPKFEDTAGTVDIFLSSRYSTGVFMGIMIDTGASFRSTASHNQYLALKKTHDIELDKSRAGEAKVQFGIGSTTSLGTVDLITPIGKVTFHVVSANAPFLLSIKDMDELRVKLDDLENVLIQGEKYIPIIRAYGHPWMLLDKNKTLAYFSQEIQGDNLTNCHLTEIELRRLHRRFGHPSVARFHKVLQRAGHETNFESLKRLTEYCEQC
ncbi:hypothetical protein K3495_g9443 [Podosphaera aphanis]|nr:hypothetical protein K3495_g9443 [Podosphaera aphanis]